VGRSADRGHVAPRLAAPKNDHDAQGAVAAL